MEHWLLYTSDREHGGTVIEGIFSDESSAWEYYRKLYTEEGRYWRIPFVECWENGKKIEEEK